MKSLPLLGRLYWEDISVFLCRPSGWLLTTKRLALLAEMPKHLKQRKKIGNKAFKERNYKLTHELCPESLGIVLNNIEINAQLCCDQGTANSKLRKLRWCNRRLHKCSEVRWHTYKSLLEKSSVLHGHQSVAWTVWRSMWDNEKVYQTKKTSEHNQLLKNALLVLQKSKRKDHFKILGVDEIKGKIKKAYWKRAFLHHPCGNSGPSARVQKENRFKEGRKAFPILFDPK